MTGHGHGHDHSEVGVELRPEFSLSSASREGDFDRVVVLLQRGRNPNAADESGYVPLHFASRSGHINIVKELLRSLATVDPRFVIRKTTRLLI